MHGLPCCHGRLAVGTYMIHRLSYCGGLGQTILYGGSGATAAMADAIPTPISFPAGPRQPPPQGENPSPG